tara:strand:+ start:1127 stop:1264 length:138 start_codon:yes stop_codon:yes gene_type:complete
MPVLRKIAILREFFWNSDNEDLEYIYNMERFMEKLKIYESFPKWS